MEYTKLVRGVAFLLFMLFVFSACQSDIDKSEQSAIYIKSDYTLYPLGRIAGLDEDTEWQIILAYLKNLQIGGKNAGLTINDVWVDQYYGAYCPGYLFPKDADEIPDFLRTDYLDPKNHTVVAFKVCFTNADYGTTPRDVIINTPNGFPLVLRYYDKGSILVWDRGHLYDMEKDTEYINLTAWDFRKIVNRHNGLDFETDAMIREDIRKFILTGWIAEDNASISMLYLGTYNGYTALTLFNGATSQAEYQQLVGSVLFYYPTSPIRIFAWKEEKIYQLDNLYKQSLITHEDLVEMAYFHHAGKEN